jgi:hypothetical protein
LGLAHRRKVAREACRPIISSWERFVNDTMELFKPQEVGNGKVILYYITAPFVMRGII